MEERMEIQLLIALRENDHIASMSILWKIFEALMMEIEVLRKTMIEESKAKGIAPKDSIYARIYEEETLNSYWGRNQRIISKFFPRPTNPDVPDLRETLMLIRLGYSVEEIEKYKKQVQELMGRS
jgi:hypothetical protein